MIEDSIDSSEAVDNLIVFDDDGQVKSFGKPESVNRWLRRDQERSESVAKSQNAGFNARQDTKLCHAQIQSDLDCKIGIIRYY